MGALRDLDRLLAVFALVPRLVFLTLVLRLAFLAVAFLAVVLVSAFLAVGLVLSALFRVLAALVTERRRASFSGLDPGAAAAIGAGGIVTLTS